MITDKLLEEIEKGREGSSWGYSTGLPKLDGIIDGVTRGTYTLVFAVSGGAKTSFGLYSYIYRPLMEHLDDDNFKVTMFALEMKAEILLAKMLSTYIFETYNKTIGFKELLSRRKGYRLSDKDMGTVKDCIPWMRKVESKMNIYDKSANAESVYAIMMKELKEEGDFSETENRKIYTPKNPKLIHIVAIDHMGLLTPSKGRSLKQEIDITSHFLVTLRNMCNISPLVIMQSNREASSSARRQLGFFLPQTSDVKESNGPVEDSDIVIALYNPQNDKLATHNGYDIKILDGKFRSIVVLKNRYGVNQVEDSCFFYGDVGLFRECPKADDISDYTPYLKPDWKEADIQKFSFSIDKATKQESDIFKL